MLAFLIVLVYSFIHLRALLRKHGKESHSIFHVTMKFHILYICMWIYYLLCGLRAIFLVDCSKSNPLNGNCDNLMAYNGIISLSFVLIFIMIILGLMLWAKLSIKSEVNVKQLDTGAVHWTVLDNMNPNSLPSQSNLAGTKKRTSYID